MSEKSLDGVDHLERSIDWKQGLAIAMGVPLLILPSLGYLPMYLSAAAILIWGLSVVQGFFQNAAYAEMATTFPKASGLPGFAQHIFRTENYRGKYDKGKLIGGFSAWSYWFAWTPVLAIFSILVGGYLHGLFPVLGETFTEYQLSLISGVVIFAGLFVVNWFGLKDGAILGYILAAVSLIPLVVLTVAPFATGHVELANITGNWLPADWAWDMHHILILLGIFAIAQWSACAWETAAIYGPEYKNPAKDVPKALLACGIICFFSFVLVQAAVIGVLGVDGVQAEPVSPLIPVAQAVFGEAGSIITIIMLIAAMILIIQTAYLGSSRAMHSMATEGNLPKVSRQNEPPRHSLCCHARHRSLQSGADFHGKPCGNCRGIGDRLHLRQWHQPVRLRQGQKAPCLRWSGTAVHGAQGLEKRRHDLRPVQSAPVPDRCGLPEQPGDRLDLNLGRLHRAGALHPHLVLLPA